MPRLLPLSWAYAVYSVFRTSVLVVCSWLCCVGSGTEPDSLEQFLTTHCLDCHSSEEPEGGLALDRLAWILDPTLLARQSDPVDQETMERMVKKLRTRQMPPGDSPRPADEEYQRSIAWLETQLDLVSAAHANPGRTDSLRRMNRTEFQNAIRDLLALDIDAQAMLPTDEASHGFDNMTLGDLSPTLLNRYVSAAEKISRMALGRAGHTPGGETFRIQPDLTQDGRMAGLPLGSRGGALIPYTFPRSGEYEIELRLTRDRNEHVEGLGGEHTLEVLIDRHHAADFTIRSPKDQDHSTVDRHLKTRLHVEAGPHDLGITFVRDSSALIETMRQPLESHFNVHRHPRQSPALFQVSITGPFSKGGVGDTPSRQRVLTCRPNTEVEEQDCAKSIIANLTRRAFRRPSTPTDIAGPLRFYQAARDDGGDFEAGIEAALSAILVSPQFLFRIEVQPDATKPGDVYQVSQLELASRLSFFLWSSIPDEELLGLAEQGRLRDPNTLQEQVRRMLLDQRASNLVSNFAAQWLYLRNLDSITPDARLFPDFDDNLRQAFRAETELLFEEIMREDRSVIELLSSDHTFLNERLAKHYQIPHIYGPQFRRVDLAPDSRRGGLLRHGSILTITSYATRTSPVIRGHWILKNLLGASPPPPPPNVPALEDNTVSAELPMRERLAVHRANAACAACHNLMDPIGFSLENFDAVGRWREYELGQPVDATGSLPGGGEFAGVDGLEQALLQQPEMFVGAMAEKLLAFAIGRGVEHYDAPAIRKIVRAAAAQDDRFSSLITGIVSSTPFQMRKAQ